MDILARAEEYARKLRRQSLSKLATYQRGSVAKPLLVTQAATIAESDDGELIVNTTIVDWIFEASELLISGSTTEPQPGDRIEWDGKTFELMALGGEKCWRWHGRDGKSYRVHTRLVA